MTLEQRYIIQGSGTYSFRDDLKARNCSYNGQHWITPPILKDGLMYRQLKSLADAADAEMYLANFTGKQKTVRDILNQG